MDRHDPIPICPHCGYDLSGVIASWRESCPLEGVCSECGGPLDWSEVLTAGDRELPWLIEHGTGVRRLFRRSLSTWFRSLLTPNTFWKAVSLHPSVRWSRLLVWLPLLIITMHLIKGLLANAARGIVHYVDHSSYWYWLAWASDDWTQPFLLIYYNPSPKMAVLSRQWRFTAWPPPIWGLLVASITAPAILFSISALTYQPYLRSGHVARAAVYGLAWIPVLWLLAVADSLFRFLICAVGMAIEIPIGGRDVELLFDPLWSIWPWWGLAAGAWWVWWWKCAITNGLRLREPSSLTVPVLGISVCVGVLVTATMQVFWR